MVNKMNLFTRTVLLTVVCCSFLSVIEAQYTPDWDSIDSRPLPAWYDESKIGIFIHWGIFSVPSFNSEWYFVFNERKINSYHFKLRRLWWQWKGDQPSAKVVAFMNKTYPSDWTYADFANQFRAELYGN
jgi:alpha-L-fucosidase